MVELNLKNKILHFMYSIKFQDSLKKIMSNNIDTINTPNIKSNSFDNYDHYKDQYWNNLELVQQYINKNATGNKDTIWQIDILTRFKNFLPFNEVLIIGCGNGWVERQLFDLGIGVHFDAFDVSEKYLETAQGLAASRNIRYFKADINHLENFGESRYDAIFNVGVLHHTFRLSDTLWKLSRSLKPNGLMFNFDYIGPSRNQYSNEHLKILNNINELLPKRFQSQYKLRPNKKDFDSGDPSEAIHSDLVRPIFKRYFNTIYERDLNGGIAYQILWNNIHEFKKNDIEAKEALEFLLQKDAEYTESKKIPVLFWYGVGIPKHLNEIRYRETLSNISALK